MGRFAKSNIRALYHLPRSSADCFRLRLKIVNQHTMLFILSLQI